MNNEDDPFYNKMNLPQPQNDLIKSMLTQAHNDSAMEDFTTSRANVLALLDQIDTSIEELMKVSKSSQHPRAYEVLANLYKTKVEANRELLQLQSKIREIDEANQNTSGQGQTGDTINNNLFLSTNDMLDLLKQANPKQIENQDGEDN